MMSTMGKGFHAAISLSSRRFVLSNTTAKFFATSASSSSSSSSTSSSSSSNRILDIGHIAKIDLDRSKRNGFPEVIFASGKTSEHLIRILEEVHRKTEDLVIATRISAEQLQALQNAFHVVDDATSRHSDALPTDNKLTLHYCKESKIAYIASQLKSQSQQKTKGHVAVLCAGTSDYHIAEEAVKLLELSQVHQITRLYDVGVAGIHRLLNNIHHVQDADVVIVCAGMDGALPSVVGGLVTAPVIAVPTSIGYGASFHGVSALLTMLNTCAPGVTVVNIDNGFGAAVTAFKMLKKMNDFAQRVAP